MKSKRPGKQRKFLYNAPLHVRRKMIASHLSKELREKYKTRSFQLRRGDEIESMRGRFKGKKGKVSSIDTKNYKVYVEGFMTKKTDKTERQAPLHASKLKIISLDLSDKKRMESLNRKLKPVEGKAK